MVDRETKKLIIKKVKEQVESLQETVLKNDTNKLESIIVKKIQQLEKKILERQNEEILNNRKIFLKTIENLHNEMKKDIAEEVKKQLKN